MASRGEYGQPLPGAREAMQRLLDAGHRVSVFTARLGEDDAHAEAVADEVAAALEDADIPYSDIWVGRKPRADVFIDDRAVAFEGDWEAALDVAGLERAAGTGPSTLIDTVDDENDFLDPWGSRRDLAIERDPEREELLYG